MTRVITMLRPIREMPPLSPLRVAALLMMAVVSVLSGIAMYYVLGQSIEAPASYLVYCLIVPLVWIIRMIPVSLGGLGVGEGAFVLLAGIFAIPAGQALAIAVGFLAVQTASALIGGLLLALRMLRGTWIGRPAPEAQK
jgi:glycosyltransferase 2 family protein